nr:MAG TPA: hypothetical protein [Caudoviricetes sp.]
MLLGTSRISESDTRHPHTRRPVVLMTQHRFSHSRHRGIYTRPSLAPFVTVVFKPLDRM